MRQGKKNTEADFYRYVNENGPVPDNNPELGPCWIWMGVIDSSQGYGKFFINGKQIWAHKFSFGKVPAGKQLDHLCRNRKCVNPTHLEPVTRKENILRGEGFSAINARKTHCVNGHPFDGVNSYTKMRGISLRRICRACCVLQRQRTKQRIAALAESQPAPLITCDHQPIPHRQSDSEIPCKNPQPAPAKEDE